MYLSVPVLSSQKGLSQLIDHIKGKVLISNRHQNFPDIFLGSVSHQVQPENAW